MLNSFIYIYMFNKNILIYHFLGVYIQNHAYQTSYRIIDILSVVVIQKSGNESIVYISATYLIFHLALTFNIYHVVHVHICANNKLTKQKLQCYCIYDKINLHLNDYYQFCIITMVVKLCLHYFLSFSKLISQH